MIRHVIWDFDGTLFDTYPVMSAAFREALIALGDADAPAAEDILREMKKTLDTALRRCVTDRGLSLEAFQARYAPLRREAEFAHAAPFPAIPPLLRAIRAAGGENYVFTHRSRTTLPLLDKYGLATDFREIVTAEDGFPRKPSPAAIEYLLEKYGIARDEALMVGDRALDIGSGLNAGIHTCLLGDDPEARAEFRVERLEELYGILGIERA